MWGQEGRALRVSTPTSSAEGLLPQASSMPVFPSACWLRSEWGLGREEEALLSLRPLTMAGRAPLPGVQRRDPLFKARVPFLCPL